MEGGGDGGGGPGFLYSEVKVELAELVEHVGGEGPCVLRSNV